MPDTSNAAVVGRIVFNSSPYKENTLLAVQYESAVNERKIRGKPRTLAEVLDSDLLTVDEAAEVLGIPSKRLRGFIFRNGVDDPIGDAVLVYGWSLKGLAARTADTDSEVPRG